MKYTDLRKLFRKVAENQFRRATEAAAAAGKTGVNPGWYAFWMKPRNLHEKYEFGYWLNFYLYRDMRQWASTYQKDWVPAIDKAYYSGNWELLNSLIK